MGEQPLRFLGLAGALRAGSFNRRLLLIAAEALRAHGAVEVLDSAALVMPLYDGDVETRDGLPDAARRLRERIAGCDALVIATPEYNNSVPGVLKNAIDWASRPPDQPFRGRPVLLLSASPGPYGGVRAVMAVRLSLASLGAIVLPTAFSLPHADKAFDEAGQLADPRQRAQLERACAEAARITAALRAR
jgi:chromate reductase, NAD(P)H dehydrogenase (quinone)